MYFDGMFFYHFVLSSPFPSPSLFRHSRRTICIQMTTDSDLSYQPGDHVGVYAGNDPAIVDAVLDRLTPDAPDPDQVTKMEILKEKHTPLG